VLSIGCNASTSLGTHPRAQQWPAAVATTIQSRLRRSSHTNPGEHSPSFCSTTAGVVRQPSAFPRTPVEFIHCRANGHTDRLAFSSLILRQRLTNQRRCCVSSPSSRARYVQRSQNANPNNRDSELRASCPAPWNVRGSRSAHLYVEFGYLTVCMAVPDTF
jgi:hypothetical protein